MDNVIIAIAIYDTIDNDRTKYTKRTLQSLAETVDLKKHELYLIDNNSCKETKEYLKYFRDEMRDKDITINLITLQDNIGTARAINMAWSLRSPGQHCIKMDNDVVIHNNNWIEDLVHCVERDSTIGQIGLKRKDLLETPYNPENWYKSTLWMLPHTPGERWFILEESNHIIGTCVLHSSNLLDKVGYLYQPGLYGFDDAIMSLRSKLSGFKNVFLPHIEIDHIDTGENYYTKVKIQQANDSWLAYNKIIEEYKAGQRSLYQNIY